MLPIFLHHLSSPTSISKKLQWICVILGVVLLITGVVLMQQMMAHYQDRVVPGVWIENVDASNKTAAELEALLETQEAQLRERLVTLVSESGPESSQLLDNGRPQDSTQQKDGNQLKDNNPPQEDSQAKTKEGSVKTREVSALATQLGFHSETRAAIDQALAVGKEHFWQDGAWRIMLGTGEDQHLSIERSFQSDAVRQLVDQLKKATDVPGKEPEAVLKYSGTPSSLTISEGAEGKELNQTKAVQLLQEAVARPEKQIVLHLSQEVVGKRLSSAEATAAQTRAMKLVGKSIGLKIPDREIVINDQKLISLLSFSSGIPSVTPSSSATQNGTSQYNARGISQTKLNQLVDELYPQITREPQDAVFEYDATTLKVRAFTPPRNGLAIEKEALATIIKEQVETLEKAAEETAAQQKLGQSEQTTSQTGQTTAPGGEQQRTPLNKAQVELPLTVKQPTRNLADTNTLGIRERIGFGDSRYAHSIANRVHNVALAASRINNTIVKPGEEFSFNRTLGEVSQATGFKPGYIIQGSRTVLGDGGGVCQVSTTLFRALLNTGVPITARRPHSFRVSYYELNSKPGVDATVYPGSADLKFINDTGQHLLIHMETDSKNLYMTTEIYGTSDGRTTEIRDHKTWDYRGPGAPLYIDDPSLPPGRVKQVETAVPGIKASFVNVVKDKDGTVIREVEYFSNYIPWRAVFMRGI